MPAKVKLGSIGLGWWGGVLASAIQSSNRAEIVSCYARTPNRRMQFASVYGCANSGSLDELLGDPDIDGVVIATPHTTHAELAIAAAEAGKHIFIDKPLTLDSAAADNVISAVDRSGVVLQVGHNRRRQAANRRIHKMISSGDLGEVHHFHAVHSAPLLQNPNLALWRRKVEENPAGGMAALGVHQIDTFHYLGGPITKVSAVSKRLSSEGEVHDTTAVLLEFASGAIGDLFTSQATGPIVDVQVDGTEASARNVSDGSICTFQQRGSSDVEEVEIEPLDTISDEVEEFALAIHGETQPETGPSEGRAVVAVFEAIVRSAGQGGALINVTPEL